MITDLEYTSWLSSPSAMRCVLVEANVQSSGVEIVRYFSNKGYVTSPTDTPANTVYRALLKGSVSVTENLSLTSQPAFSYGDIELDNTDSGIDSWIQDVWENREVSVYFGDMKWGRSDFRLVFKGLLAGIGSKGRNRMNLSLRDGLQRLNTPLSDTKLGGTSINKDRLIPLCFGECHNVSPLLTNAATHEYQYHAGSTEGVIEVRDNGAPINVTSSVGTGKFSLAASPAGTITASVQGRKVGTYTNQIKDIITDLVTNYGEVTNRLDLSDIDTDNFSSHTITAPIGLFTQDKMNLLEACQQVAGSVGAQVAMSRTGLLQLHRISFPPLGTPRDITKKDIVENSLQIDSKLDVSSSVKVGYCKNWTVENNLQTAIPEDHKSLYEQEWLTVTSTDSSVASKYKQLQDSSQIDTLLLVASDANTEATRRLDIIKNQRVVYKFTGFSSLLDLKIGQTVSLTHTRYDLSEGKLGTVVGLEPDWTNSRITVKVIT